MFLGFRCFITIRAKGLDHPPFLSLAPLEGENEMMPDHQVWRIIFFFFFLLFFSKKKTHFFHPHPFLLGKKK